MRGRILERKRMTLKTGLKFLRNAVLLSVATITPAMASNMELQAFEEICEITGEVKTSLRYVPVSLSLDAVVEGISLDDNNSK